MSDAGSDNMNEEHIITVCPEQLSTTRARESSSSSNDIVISVDEITLFIEEITDVTPPAEEAASSGEMGQCRFCHEEDFVSQLEAPCACTGSLKYAHRSCTIGWCNAKGDTICEICRQHYGPDYTVTEPSSGQITRDVPSTPTTVTQVQSPLQQPHQRVAALHRWRDLIVPSRSVLYSTLLVLFLLALIMNDIFSLAKTPKKDQKKAFNVIFVVIMMILAPFALLSCLYEFQALLRGDFDERDRTASGRANGGGNPSV